MANRLIQLSRTSLFILMVFTCSFVVILSPNFSSAATKGLTVSPLRTELDIAPGTSIDGVLTVTNSSTKPMTVDLSATVFSVINQQYDYAFTEDSDVVKWVTFDYPQVDLAIGQSKKITYTVGVPLSAEPGGRYISMFASSDSEGVDSGVGSRQRIASLIYLTVTGDVTREGNLISLNSPLIVSTAGSWSATLQNTGTTHFRSRFSIDTRTLFGGEVTSTTGDALILPGTVRSLTGDLKLPNYPGIYKVVYTIGLGDTPAVVVTKYEIYLPPIFFLGVAVIAVAVVLARTFIKSRRHRRP